MNTDIIVKAIGDVLDEEKLDYIDQVVIKDCFGKNSKKKLIKNMLELIRCSENISEMILCYDQYEDSKEQYIYDLTISMNDYVYHCAICTVYLVAVISSENVDFIDLNFCHKENFKDIDADEIRIKLKGFEDYMKEQGLVISPKIVCEIVYHSKNILKNITNLTVSEMTSQKVSIMNQIIGSMGIMQYLNVEFFKQLTVGPDRSGTNNSDRCNSDPASVRRSVSLRMIKRSEF